MTTINTQIKSEKKNLEAWEIFKNDPCRREMIENLTKLRNDTMNSLLDEDSVDDKYKKLLIKFINRVINHPEHIQSDLKAHLESLKFQKEEDDIW
jgi:hypothetical protein